MYRLIASLWLLLTCFSGAGLAQQPELIKEPEFERDARAAVDSIYNFRAEAAKELLEPWREKHPGHPLWPFMEAMEFWWEVLSDLEDTSNDEAFFDAMKKADFEASKVLSRNSSHIDALVIKAVSNGYIARQHANRESWVTSINTSREAFKAYRYLREAAPGLPDLKLAEGLKLYYSALLPERYPVVKTVSWALPDGDREKGLQVLGEAAREGVFARAEAAYFLGNINYLYERDYRKASGYLEELYRAYPRNNYYARVLVKNYVRLRDYDRALGIIDESLRRFEDQQLPYADVLAHELLTLKGRILYEQSDYDSALRVLLEAIENGERLPRSDHRAFQAQAHFYTGRLYAHQNQDTDARRHLEKASSIDTKSSYVKQARDHLKRLNSR